MKNSNTVKQFVLYLIVGGIATIVEWVVFYIINTATAIHYSLATALAFAISTFANWLRGRLIMFSKSEKGTLSELAHIYLASIAGLIMNIAIMGVCVELLGIGEFTAKVIATGIVFFWNFLIRKIVIYKV